MKYFRMTVIHGEWGKAEKYLSSFMNLDDDKISRLFFDIRKQKYYEALDRYMKISLEMLKLKGGFFKMVEKTKRENVVYLLSIARAHG